MAGLDQESKECEMYVLDYLASNEAEKVSKQSREFETRFNRSVFETKQQVSILSIRFYVKSFLENVEVQKMTFLQF